MASASSCSCSSSSFSLYWLLVLFLWVYTGELGRCMASKIMLGSNLVAGTNQVWFSDNRTFAFGFNPAASNKGLFHLAIWYAELPGDRVEVWSANRNSPVGKDAILELDATGNLVLTDRKSIIWMSNTSRAGVNTAQMSESGNFILYNSDSRVVWQSFSHPSDTLLPGQPFNVSSELTSSSSSSRGDYYSMKMLQEPTSLSLGLTYYKSEFNDPSGNSPRNYSYWSVPEISNVTGNVYALMDETGSFGIVYGASSDGIVYVHKNDDNNVSDQMPVLRRLTIETNGNLRLYRWDNDVNGSRQWVPEWAAVSNPCDIAGICGNGICKLEGSKTNVSCSCLPGTTPEMKDSDIQCLGNMSLGIDCNVSSTHRNTGSEQFKIATVSQTNFYYSESSVIANYSDMSTTSKCGDACLSSCECVASVYGLKEEKAYCWILRSLEFGGFQDPTSTLFVKVGNDSSIAPWHDKKRSEGSSDQEKTKTLVLPIVLCMTVLIGLLCFLLYYTLHGRKSLKKALNSSLRVLDAPINFSYRDLQSATNNFSELLGTGGFGSVYKGNLGDGNLAAVKKLEKFFPHGEKEFITEVNTIGSMHHINLVRLYGFCSQGSHRLLVYEFMKNGSLDKWIFPSLGGQLFRDKTLDWKTRFNIAIATAQGIAYFHEQCRNRIIHCDIKPENILLDENFCPKISDFGLAKLMGREHSQVVTMVRGTRGYLAPEWITNRPITVKADAYSYGMLLLEIIGGRRNLDMSLDARDFFYPGWAFKEMSNGTPMKVADKRLLGAVEEDELVRALRVAFWCIQDEVLMRPTMGEVVKMLEGSEEVNQPPMPQAVLELLEEGLDHVYRAMKRDFRHHDPSQATTTYSYSLTTHPSSHATCSYSTMSPR